MPVTSTVAAPRWTVATPVPLASASTPMLFWPSFSVPSLATVIELPAPKPVMLALTLALVFEVPACRP